MQKSKNKTLVRYTNIAFLLDYLHTGNLSLVLPDYWRDRNDVYFIDEYRKHKGGAKVFALCFTQGTEEHHFWDISAVGVGGIAIEFDGDGLEFEASKCGIIGKSVQYKKIEELREGDLEIESLPFTKRYPYKAENEYRLFYLDEKSEYTNESTYSFPVPFGLVSQIRLSPTLPENVKQSIKNVIRQLMGNDAVRIYKSTLLENPQFKALSKLAS